MKKPLAAHPETANTSDPHPWLSHFLHLSCSRSLPGALRCPHVLQEVLRLEAIATRVEAVAIGNYKKKKSYSLLFS